MDQLQKSPWSEWETVQLLGRGSFGTVYEIRRNLFDGDVESAAMKVISIPQNPGDLEEMYSEGYDDESITATFNAHLKSIVSEYSLMRKMDGSANVVNCKDIRYIQHDDGIGWDIYIRMELLTPLMKAISADISEETVVKLGKDICKALVLCKKHEIIHRDIKPQNIFISLNGDYKLGDFGIAKTVEKTMGGTKIGTYKYMAPEVYNNQPYGSSADIYSLGLVLYWLLNERRMPFMPLPPQKLTAGADETARQRRLSGEKLPEPAHGSAELKQIVLKACAFDQKDRYSSAAQMLDDLLALEKASAVVIPVVPVVPVQETVAVSEQPNMEDMTTGPQWEKKETPAKEEKRCPGCGMVVAENTKFCHACGYALLVVPVVEKTPEVLSEDATVGPGWGKIGSEDKTLDRRQDTIAKKKEAAAEKTKKKSTLPVILGIIGIILIIVVILLCLRSCGEGTPAEEKPVNTTAPTVSQQTQEQPEPVWSDWVEALPAEVSADQYEIEEKTLCSSRDLELTTSTETNTMEGWELYDTVEANGEFGPWSEWSDKKVEASETREVEKEKRYRYREKETTTGSSSKKDGWTKYDTTYTWGEFGNWSNWVWDILYASESREIESKKQYRYRSISYTTEYTNWSSWSSWQDSAVSGTNLREVQSRTVWGYYYFKCPNCGAHMYGWGIPCYTWAGGCGYSNIPQNSWVQAYKPVSWSSAGLTEFHGTGKYSAIIDGERLFKWNSGGSKTQYRYRTRSTQQITSYGSWSGWGDEAHANSSSKQVESRVVYRCRDREKIATYHFYRWGAWSDWAAKKVSATDSCQVEEKTYYRYREPVKNTTYYFRRWTEWTDYSENAETASENKEVRTKQLYRYKLKKT